MTRRTLDGLREERDRLAASYAAARRRHRGQAETAARLRDRACAQLRAEVAAEKPRRGRPPAPRAALPDLFGEARP